MQWRFEDTERCRRLSTKLSRGVGCCACLGLAACAAFRCARPLPARQGEGAGYDSNSIYAEFVYLPEKESMRVSACPESTTVVRSDSGDSVLSRHTRRNSDTAAAMLDSARQWFERVAPGEYRRDHVIDGTRIRIRHRGQEIYCDNCLHDFVLEAAGVAVPAHSGAEQKLRELVRQVSELAAAAEGQPKKKRMLAEIVVDKRAMRDSTRSYELGKVP